jgi:hypothetical protein
MDKTLELINISLDAIIHAPEMWGSNLETVELQFILLMEIKASIEKGLERRKILEAYQKFIRGKIPKAGPFYFSGLLKPGDFDTLIKYLKEFRESHS